MISIILSTYNRLDKLKRAINSVFAQTVTDWELIVADDASTDGTEDYMRGLTATNPKIKYIRLPKNHGKDTKPKNQAILASQGEYIAYLDDDNEYFPDYLENQLEMLQRTEVDVVYCDMIIIDDQNPQAPPQQAISMPFDPQVLMRKNFIDVSMVMHKRQAIFDIGGFDEKLPRFVDWNVWVRMTKWGKTFFQNKKILVKYHISKDNSAIKYPVDTWRDPILGIMFTPTFNTSGCLIWLPYLGENEAESNPKVAIWTMSYDRKDYTQRMWESMKRSTKYPFDWFVWDNNSQDGSKDYLVQLKLQEPQFKWLFLSPKNLGITGASNKLVNRIKRDNYQIMIKVDNDCEFMTKFWLESIVDMWKRNHKLYISPYPEGLLHNPGGAARVGTSFIGAYFVEVTLHIGGLFAAIDARAYDNFRWTDQFLHGNQDAEASTAFRRMQYMPLYLPMHRIRHMDGTSGQQEKYPEYFERRKGEKTQTLNAD